MSSIDILSPATLTFIQQVGFPVTISLIMLAVVFYMIKRDQKREEKHDIRYDKLVDRIFEETNKLADRQEKFNKEILNELKNLTLEIKENGIRIGEYTKIIDQELEARDKLYIFQKKEKQLK